MALNEFVPLFTQNSSESPVLQEQLCGFLEILVAAVPEAAITAPALAPKHATIAVSEYGSLQQPCFQYGYAEAFVGRRRDHETAGLNGVELGGLAHKPRNHEPFP